MSELNSTINSDGVSGKSFVPKIQPRFELSKKIVLQKYSEIEEIADIVSYSSKTNPLVTPILESNTSCDFSIHFINELQHIRDYSRVFFISQALNSEELVFLFEKGVRKFVADNEVDLDMLLDFISSHNYSDVELFLRLKLKENTIKTETHFVFGIESKIVNKRIQEIHSSELYGTKIKTLGIHFHRKTQNLAEWKLRYELEDILESKTLAAIGIINIGGGLPSFYANTNLNAMQGIRRQILDFKSFLNDKNIKLMIEPGRYISAPAVKLKTTIKLIHGNNIVVDASVYNTDLDALIVPVKLLVEGELTKEESLKDETVSAFVLKGITPCSMDLFRYRVYLKKPEIGDEIVFLNAGAYNFTTTFCDLDELKTILVD